MGPHSLAKWRYFIFFGLLNSAIMATAISGEKPRVVVITSNNGGGHNAAAEAVEKTLGPEYEVIKLYLLEDKLGRLDKKFMEYFAQEKWPLVKFMASFQPVVDAYIRHHLYSYVKSKLAKEKPDLIVSVFPLGNKVYSEVARELGIKSMIIPTDLLMEMQLRFFHKGGDQDHTIVCRAYDRESDDRVLEQRGLLKNSVITGYPVRPQFNHIARRYRRGDPVLRQELDDIREKLGMAKGDKAVLIAPIAPIGTHGVGQQAVLDYLNFGIDEVKEILPEEGPGRGILHFIVVTGKNEILFEKVKARADELGSQGDSRVVIHPEKFLPPEIYARYLALADVPIIKPGGATLNEMIALGKRVLIKSDSERGIVWERANLKFMVGKGWALPLAHTVRGRVIRQDYVNKLRKLLSLSHQTLDSPLNEFGERFKTLVDGILLTSKSSAEAAGGARDSR